MNHRVLSVWFLKPTSDLLPSPHAHFRGFSASTPRLAPCCWGRLRLGLCQSPPGHISGCCRGGSLWNDSLITTLSLPQVQVPSVINFQPGNIFFSVPKDRNFEYWPYLWSYALVSKHWIPLYALSVHLFSGMPVLRLLAIKLLSIKNVFKCFSEDFRDLHF